MGSHRGFQLRSLQQEQKGVKGGRHPGRLVCSMNRETELVTWQQQG